MRIHWIRAFTAAAVLITPVAAMAQPTAAREQTFRERDKNGDGVLTAEEYGGHFGNFRALDTNGDHVLSRDEFVNRHREVNESAPAQPAAPPVAPAAPDNFSQIDRNGDNAITRAEWRADLAPASFARLDRNHDGVITRDEFNNPLPADSAEARFAELDRNGDGVLTRSEWRADPFSFNRADRNNDNRVTVDEYVSSPVASSTDLRFQALDRDRNGVVNRNEWVGESRPFDLVDRNRDNRITADEYVNPPAGGEAERRFAVLDRNGNGVVNRGEWRGETMNFDAVDRNGDNRVTLEEYVSMASYGSGTGSSDRERRFAQLDRNRDGVLSRGEWRETADFRRADRNSDGVVTLREYLYGNVAYERPRDDDDYDQSPTSRSARFRELDDNGNGYISRSEWPDDRSEFDVLDRDRDGRLTSSEFSDTQVISDEFRRMDYDGDGVLSRREWSGTDQTFSHHDRNRDGVVSRDEYLDHH
jgi:Ca2+-binding EF-hand superfamily protein